jgi:hypothetical protein
MKLFMQPIEVIRHPRAGGGLARAKRLYKCGFAADRMPAFAGMANRGGVHREI